MLSTVNYNLTIYDDEGNAFWMLARFSQSSFIDNSIWVENRDICCCPSSNDSSIIQAEP